MRYPLPNVGGKPISHRVCTDILEALTAGDFAALELLPSENELASRYGVSRSVIRDALSALEREGFLQRMRGIGTVVHRDIVGLGARLDLKREYYELIRGMGRVPGVDSVSLRREPACARIAGQLNIREGDALIVCEKRLLASGVPVIYSVDRLPAILFDGVAPGAIDWSRPVFDLLEEHLGFDVDTDIASLKPTLGPPDIRAKLNVRDDEALLMIDEVGYYRLTRPVFQSVGFYTDFFEFTMLRKRL